MKKIIFYSIIALLSLYLVFALNIETPRDAYTPMPQMAGTVVSNEREGDYLFTKVQLAETDQKITVVDQPQLYANPRTYEVGDDVYVVESGDDFYISDYQRLNPQIWLFVLFIAAVLLVTGWKGLGSIAGMFFSFIVIFRFLLPNILNGQDPVLMAIIAALMIIPATFYLSHQISKKTTVAVIGTILTLIVTGLIAVIFAKFSHLTGTASEEASFLSLAVTENLDFAGLVIAGLIISILGILDDITISQASIVQQLKAAKPKIKFSEAYFHAMEVGKDHIASLVNTLVLVYTGASLPLFLLFLDKSEKLSSILNLEFIAEEIIHTLVGSIGLVLAVPITTLIACLAITGKEKDENPHSHCQH